MDNNIPSFPGMPDISNITNKSNEALRVELHTGLTGDTLIFINKELSSVAQLHLGYSGKETVTYGINTSTDYTVDDCRILEVPKEIYSVDIVDITFSDETLHEFSLHCTKGSKIATNNNGFVDVNHLEVGSEVFSIYYNDDYKKYYYGGAPKVTKIDKTSKILQTPVYLFMSEYQNILIPFKIEGKDKDFLFLNMRQ